MKKLSAVVIFACAAVLLCGAIVCLPRNLFDTYCLQSATYTVFCRQTECDNAISVGYGYLVEVGSKKGLQNALNKCSQIDGVSARMNMDESQLSALLSRLRFKPRGSQVCGGSKIICGYSPLLSGGVAIDGNLVNLQISVRGSTVIFGSPLIMEAF